MQEAHIETQPRRLGTCRWCFHTRPQYSSHARTTTHDALQATPCIVTMQWNRQSETLPASGDSTRGYNRTAKSTAAEQTSTRSILAQQRTHIKPQGSIASRATDTRPVRMPRERYQAGEMRPQPTMRPHMPISQQSRKSGKPTHTRRRSNAHRGITTQRVTILSDHYFATQRASPMRAAEGAT